MKDRLLQGDYVELKYALRFFGKRSTMSANLETIIGDVHDIARDQQRTHLFIYQMENELVVKQLYHNVDIYSHDFKAELFECKTTFSIIFISFCSQSESHYFSFHEICTNFAPLRRSGRTLEESQGRNITKRMLRNSILQIPQDTSSKTLPSGKFLMALRLLLQNCPQYQK